MKFPRMQFHGIQYFLKPFRRFGGIINVKVVFRIMQQKLILKM